MVPSIVTVGEIHEPGFAGNEVGVVGLGGIRSMPVKGTRTGLRPLARAASSLARCVERGHLGRTLADCPRRAAAVPDCQVGEGLFPASICGMEDAGLEPVLHTAGELLGQRIARKSGTGPTTPQSTSNSNSRWKGNMTVEYRPVSGILQRPVSPTSTGK